MFRQLSQGERQTAVRQHNPLLFLTSTVSIFVFSSKCKLSNFAMIAFKAGPDAAQNNFAKAKDLSSEIPEWAPGNPYLDSRSFHPRDLQFAIDNLKYGKGGLYWSAYWVGEPRAFKLSFYTSGMGIDHDLLVLIGILSKPDGSEGFGPSLWVYIFLSD